MPEYGQNDTPDLHRMVDELVKDHTHREPYIVRGSVPGVPGFIAHHRAKVPSLIDQLLDPDPPAAGEMSGSAPQSRPVARVEAYDTIALIAEEAGEWIDHLGGTIPGSAIEPGRKLKAMRGSGAKRCLVTLRSLVVGLPGDDRCGREHGSRVEVEIEPESGFDSKNSLLGDLEDGLDMEPVPTRREWCCTTHHVEADVRTWWRQARIISGWDSPTYRPYASCPHCSQRKGLRINLASSSAVCVECRTVWGPEALGLLAEHIRQENAEGGGEDGEDETLEDLAETS